MKYANKIDLFIPEIRLLGQFLKAAEGNKTMDQKQISRNVKPNWGHFKAFQNQQNLFKRDLRPYQVFRYLLTI